MGGSIPWDSHGVYQKGDSTTFNNSACRKFILNQDSGTPGGPITDMRGFAICDISPTSGFGYQMFIHLDTRVFLRTAFGGSWSEWNQVSRQIS